MSVSIEKKVTDLFPINSDAVGNPFGIFYLNNNTQVIEKINRLISYTDEKNPDNFDIYKPKFTLQNETLTNEKFRVLNSESF